MVVMNGKYAVTSLCGLRYTCSCDWVRDSNGMEPVPLFIDSIVKHSRQCVVQHPVKVGKKKADK